MIPWGLMWMLTTSSEWDLSRNRKLKVDATIGERRPRTLRMGHSNSQNAIIRYFPVLASGCDTVLTPVPARSYQHYKPLPHAFSRTPASPGATFDTSVHSPAST